MTSVQSQLLSVLVRFVLALSHVISLQARSFSFLSDSDMVRDADAMLEHLRKQAEAEKSMLTGAVVFGFLCVVVLIVLFMNHASWRKHSLGRV